METNKQEEFAKKKIESLARKSSVRERLVVTDLDKYINELKDKKAKGEI